MLKLELVPSSLANRLLFFMLARLVSGAAAFIVFLFINMIWGGVLLAVFLLVSVGYYMYLHRLALTIFLLAQQAPTKKPEAEG